MKAPLIFLFLTLSEFCLGMEFTALEIDNHPCKPENLKVLFNTTISATPQSLRPYQMFQLIEGYAEN